MTVSPRQFLVKFPAFLFALVISTAFSWPAFAQQPAPLKISVTPQADFAVAGQTFAYTVAITNAGPQPLHEVLVNVTTPAGTSLDSTYFVNPKWFVGGISPGESGTVTWFTPETMAPGEVMEFELTVRVSPEVTRALVNKDYTAGTVENPAPAATGQPVITRVIIPTPTPTLLPSPTPLPAPVFTATATPTPVTVAGAVPEATPTGQIPAETGPETAKTPAGPEARGFPVNLVLAGIGLLILLLIILAGIIRFLKRA